MSKQATLGAVIRMRRGQLGLTQQQLAERIGHGVRQAEVSRLESGRITLPRRERLEHIAAALELSLGELLARSGWSGADVAFGSVDSPPPDPAPQDPSPVAGVSPRATEGRRRLQSAVAEAAEMRRRTARTLAASRKVYAEALGRCDTGWRDAPADAEEPSDPAPADDPDA